MLLFPPTKSTIFLKIIFEYYENKIILFSVFIEMQLLETQKLERTLNAIEFG